MIDLDTGSYFSLVGTAGHIWAAIDTGASIDEVAVSLRGSFTGVPDGVEATVAAFLAELAAAELVVSTDAGVPPSDSIGGTPPAAWEAPALVRFDDMQELILLDPIHDVDEAEGWPSAKQE